MNTFAKITAAHHEVYHLDDKTNMLLNCEHAVGVDQNGLLLHDGGLQQAPDCDIMELIKFNYCPYCRMDLRKKGENHESSEEKNC